MTFTNTIAALTYMLTSVFVWFFIGSLFFKVDPKASIIIFVLLIINKVSSIVLMGEKK